MRLFNEEIRGQNDWGRLFQSIPAFTALANYILEKERLPIAPLENLTPGTNAVFKAGELVLKIFAPPESGFYQSTDLQTELFCVKRAMELGVAVPKLIAEGAVEDKYHFAYMICEYIQGRQSSDAVKGMTAAEKFEFGQKLRKLTDKLNVPCEPFNDIDAVNDLMRYRRWDKYPDSFKKERLEYIRAYEYGERVLVHGDLCGDNIMIDTRGEVYLIDFADALLAPKIYECIGVVFDFWEEPEVVKGYLGDVSREEFFEICFNGLLIHDFGGDMVRDRFGGVEEFVGLDVLRCILGTTGRSLFASAL